MRENEFEKQVHQKMEELNLPPSPEVWEEVERRIRKEKKRRFIFWWPLLFLILGGGIAAGIRMNNKKEQPVMASGDKEDTKQIQMADDKQTTPVKPAPETVQPLNKEKSTAADITSVDKTNTAANKNIAAQRDEPVISAGEIKKRTVKKPVVVKRKDQHTDHAISFQQTDKDKENKISNTAAPVLQQTTAAQQPQTNNIASAGDINNVAVSADTIVQHNVVTTDSVNNKTEAEEPVAKKEKAGSKKKITWGITVLAGRSSIREGFGFSSKSLYADAAYNQTTGSPAQVSSSASVIRPSFSWSAALFMTKPLSKKVELYAGVGYTYLSAKNNVGSRVDSLRTISNSASAGLSVNNFYRASGSSSIYTNRFHFLGLSADLSWAVIQKKKFKLYWENGLSYNFLVGSTMLHYDRSLPGYYRDNSLLRKGQLFFSTGLSVPIGKKMYVSPFAGYSLTHVLKNADSVKTNFSSYGIRFRIFMNKK